MAINNEILSTHCHPARWEEDYSNDGGVQMNGGLINNPQENQLKKNKAHKMLQTWF